MNAFNRTHDYKLEQIFENMITPVSKDSKDLTKNLLDSNLGFKIYVNSKYFSLIATLEKGERFDYSLSTDDGSLMGHFNFNDVKRVYIDENNPDKYLSIELK